MNPTGLNRARVDEYLDRFPSCRVAVLGDVMLDRYFWGHADRISPEAPVPVVRVTRRTTHLGGAANVASNLRALGVDVTLVGIIGDDSAGIEIRSLLEENGISHDQLRPDEGRETTEKVRIIAQSQQVVRADFETEAPLSEKVRRVFLERLADGADDFDALIVSDYGKGVVQESYLGEIIRAWRNRGKPVLVDPHIGHFAWYRGAAVMTPNTREAASFYGMKLDLEEMLASVGFRMREELELGALLITRGEDGMSLFIEGGKQIHIPTVAKEVYDVTGAGDTVISILAAAVGSGAPLIDSVVIANQGAGEVVKDVGTSTVTRDRISKSFE
jgi:D-beta-D-heptose 7-phosphate kinase/D-beta-D-heptose 1-phosphate adenosyltransferase